jgi:two-component system OmpR family response regulator
VFKGLRADTGGRALTGSDETGRPESDDVRPRVLLIEDDTAVATALRLVLDRSSMITEWAATGAAARELTRSFLPDIVLVDLELPDANGMDLIRWLQENHDCGKIILTGNPEAAERVIGLEIGADDYMQKPPPVRELIARIRAVHRRTRGRRTGEQVAAPARPGGHYQVGSATIDLPMRRVVDAANRVIELTSAEFGVIEVLIAAQGQPVSRDVLSEKVLRRPWRAEDRSVDQLVFQVRTKLVPEDKDHLVIQTVRGAGYRLILPPLA